MSKCNQDVEVRAWVIIVCLALVLIIASCFSGPAKADGVFAEVGLTAAHRDLDEPYLAIGYRHKSGFGGAVAGWNYVESITEDSTFLIYDPSCNIHSCTVVGSGTVTQLSTETRRMAAITLDYELRHRSASLSVGAGYLSRATDVEDRRVVPTASVALVPKTFPCGLSLRALGRWGLVGARCTF